RSRLGLSTPTPRRRRHRRPPRRPSTGGHRSRLGRAGPSVLTVPHTRRPQERPIRRRGRDRTRARRVLVGRDDRKPHRRMITTTALECLAIGAEPPEQLPTRRDTAAAEPTPAGNPTTANI